MKSTTAWTLLLVSLIIGVQYAHALEKKRQHPNVIIILTDDQGYGDIGYHNNPQIKTPTLDKLAQSSVRFNRFYACPVCAPTRAGLMTGRYALRTGVFDTYSGGAIMASEETTIAELFQKAGYTTGHFGKWHLGDSYPSRPHDQGFDTSVWHLSGGIGQVGDVLNYYKGDSAYFNPTLFRNNQVFQSKGYCSDVFTSEAIDFVKENQKRPFFMYLAFNAPHTPLQVPQKYYDQYKDMEITSTDANGQYIHSMSKRDKEAARKVYAMVTNIDDNLKRLFDTLKKNKLEKNTIILFMTDNGPQQWRYTGGFRGKKSDVREGGVRVPCFMKIPGKSNRDVACTSSIYDILPTLADLCNVELPKHLELDGISLAQQIDSPKQTIDRTIFMEWQRGYPERYRNMAVIHNSYKALCDRQGKKFELYDLANDPFEEQDISTHKPQVVRQLKSKIDNWYSDIMASDHLHHAPRIIVGSSHEKKTILNRNDAKGLPLIWAQDNIQVAWDITVAKDALFDVKVYFRTPLKQAGDLSLRIGTTMKTIHNDKTGIQSLTFKQVALQAGEYRLDSWYNSRWPHYITPFYIEIEKTNNHN
ncbi:arylsulfatase [Prolixibacteraceae bacterium JC049]|nr:arylsulfatase [Prolixibacteraceae bacterium JC049]